MYNMYNIIHSFVFTFNIGGNQNTCVLYRYCSNVYNMYKRVCRSWIGGGGERKKKTRF